MTEDIAGNPILGAAESWSVSADGTVYTFTLRKDGFWSDGVPVTSEDFVFGMRRILAPETAAAYASILYPIKNAGGPEFWHVGRHGKSGRAGHR